MENQVEIVHADDSLVVVAKAPGVPSQDDPSGAESALALSERVLGRTLHPVHRLDRPASGLLLFAAAADAAASLSRMLRDGKIERRYWAIVEGSVEPEHAELRHYLHHDRKRNKSYVTATGKPAVSRYEIRARGERYTLLEVELETGRHHQVRAQLAAIGSPIRGDLKYGARRSLPTGGIGLLAVGLAFLHPADGTVRRFVASPPDDALWNALTDGLQPLWSTRPEKDSASE
ncbi:MAG: RluA family pseudouridine synthase [Spirochaetota bacterium]